MSDGTAAESAVILVHGLWTGRWAMRLIAYRLARRGWRTYGFAYPSVSATLSANAEALARFAAAIPAARIHWLGHSLGGAIICRALLGGMTAGDGRVVLLGTPLRGSFAAAHLSRSRLGRALLGRSIAEGMRCPLNAWLLPNELGIIAGSGGIGLGRFVAPHLPAPHDGAVSVDETRVAGAKEHLVLPVSHSALLLSQRVAQLAANFLHHSRFDDAAADTP